MTKKDDLKKEKIIELIGKSEVVAFGIDQGYANLGFSVVKYNILTEEVEILYVKGFTTPAKDLLNKSVLDIYTEIKSLLNSNVCENLDAIGCEKLFFNEPMRLDKSLDYAKATVMRRNKSASIMKTNMITGILYLLSAEIEKPAFVSSSTMTAPGSQIIGVPASETSAIFLPAPSSCLK